ncbi:hypothetical protein OUZ56_012331 [Daphnia magna]|uniref:Uncharacterized protein n=1 Tax=Daphnia magna TaxID=35525 RepID=A0ABQ9Z2P6_9CRUS|nr:hypothetical protein OUZ56_012331 [Daphnia magna]
MLKPNDNQQFTNADQADQGKSGRNERELKEQTYHTIPNLYRNQIRDDPITNHQYNLRRRYQERRKTLLFLLCLLHSLNPTYPIYSSVYDCNNMKIRGILDFELPYYCDNEKPETQHLPRIPTTYTLVTKQKPAATWKGWTCRQWDETKKITGSF